MDGLLLGLVSPGIVTGETGNLAGGRATCLRRGLEEADAEVRLVRFAKDIGKAYSP